MKTKSIWYLLPLLGLACLNCADAALFGPKGDDVEEKKANVRKQRDEMLAELFRSQPSLQATINKAAGYATFKNVNVNLLLLATANGYGMVVDNKTRKETFMRMGSLGGGVGAGVKDVRVVFVFHDAALMRQFIDEGWQFGGTADASAKYKNTGVAGDQPGTATMSAKEAGIAGGAGTDVRAGVTKTDSASGQSATKTGLEIYQFTESGVSLQATVSGTKYWKDKKLNQ